MDFGPTRDRCLVTGHFERHAEASKASWKRVNDVRPEIVETRGVMVPTPHQVIDQQASFDWH